MDILRVVDRKLWIIRHLNDIIDEAVDYAKLVHVQCYSCLLAGFDQCILFVEVVEECWAIMSSVALSPQVERQILDSAIKCRQFSQERLQNFPSTNGRDVRCVIALRKNIAVPARCIFSYTRDGLIFDVLVVFVLVPFFSSTIRKADTDRLR